MSRRLVLCYTLVVVAIIAVVALVLAGVDVAGGIWYVIHAIADNARRLKVLHV